MLKNPNMWSIFEILFLCYQSSDPPISTMTIDTNDTATKVKLENIIDYFWL